MSDPEAASSLDALAELAAKRAGRPPRLVVEGVGGSGKTALLRQLERLWRSDGLDVVWVQGRRLEADRPGAALRPFGEAPSDPWTAAARLTGAVGASGVVVVDDVQWLDDLSLRALCAAAGDGVPLVVAHRPTLRPAAAALLSQLAGAAAPLVLGPLDVDGVAGLAKDAGGAPPLSADDVARLHRRSAGRPAWARRLLASGPGDDPEAMPRTSSVVAYELAVLGDGGRRIVTALAVGAAVEDHEVLTSLLGESGAPSLGDALFEVRAAGLLGPDGQELVPVVAEAVLALTPAAERERLAVEVAPGRLLLRRAEAALAEGEPVPALALAERAAARGADPWGARRVTALALSAQGLPSAAAGRLSSLEAGPRPLEALDAVPLLVAGGDVVEARRLLAALGPATTSVAEDVSRLVAEAMFATVDAPATALGTLVDAVRLAEAAGGTAVLSPVSPHALATVVASALGLLPLAQRLAGRASRWNGGGQLHRRHHHLLTGWLAMRCGRWSGAEEVLDEDALDRRPPGLLAVALDAALARRSGDVARMGRACDRARDLLVGWKPDLLSLEVVGELAAASARLGRWEEVAPVARQLGAVVDGLGRPPLWEVPRRWLGLQAAVAADDAAATSRRAVDLAALASEAGSGYARSLSSVGGVWAATLSGRIDVDAVDAAARALQELSLPWEASRLLGAAAIRADDASVTRRLLEEARDLRAGLSSPSEGELGSLARSGVLSERERQVAAGVAEGLTYKELGERLFISPKTVEHHVAKIRQKLGISSRSEMLSALRATRGGGTA